MAIDENDIVQATRDGDRDALGELIAAAGNDVRQKLAGAIPTRRQSLLTIDDVMQQTYTDAFLDIQAFEPHGDGAFEAWLTTLAKRNLIDAIRMLGADKRGGKHKRVINEEDSAVEFCEQLTGTGTTPSQAFSKKEASRAVLQAVRRLPPTY